jgi:hypothetical protein
VNCQNFGRVFIVPPFVADWLDSLKEFARRLSQSIVSGLLLGLGGILGVISLFVAPSQSGKPFLPRETWYYFLIAGVIWGAFRTFHFARKERDEMASLLATVAFSVVLTNAEALPRIARRVGTGDTPGYQIRLTFQNASDFPLRFELTNVQVTPDGLEQRPIESVGELAGFVPRASSRTFMGWYYTEIVPVRAMTIEYNLTYNVANDNRSFSHSGTLRIAWDRVNTGESPESFWDLMVDSGHVQN